MLPALSILGSNVIKNKMSGDIAKRVRKFAHRGDWGGWAGLPNLTLMMNNEGQLALSFLAHPKVMKCGWR